MYFRRRAVAFLLSLGLAVQVAYPAPPVPADGGQVKIRPASAILRIRVIEGEGATHTAGARSTQPIVIAITGEEGRPVQGASVSLRLPEDAPTGVFANGMRTDIAVAGEDGRVVVRGIQWAQQAGTVQLRITASNGTARTGLLSTQYLIEPSASSKRRNSAEPAQGSARPQVRNESPSRSRWILIAALIGGAAASGIAARGAQSASGGAPAAVAKPTVTIGNPSITVGRP